MAFLRAVGFGLSIWDNPPEAIAKGLFNNFKDNKPSVYEASSQEEVEAVAAHALTATSKRAFHIVRITREDLAAAALTENDDTPGTTGVLAVDFRHREVLADAADGKERLIRLVARVRERLIDGEERLRWVGACMLRPHWERFRSCGNAEVTQEAKNRCQWRLGGDSSRYEPRRKSQIEEDFAATPPLIPEGRIRRRAHSKYEARGHQPGSAEGDWLEAERELRGRYRAAYLTYGLKT
jgi:hypothetical protein